MPAVLIRPKDSQPCNGFFVLNPAIGAKGWAFSGVKSAGGGALLFRYHRYYGIRRSTFAANAGVYFIERSLEGSGSGKAA